MSQIDLFATLPNKSIRLKSFTGDTWHDISFNQKTCDCSEFRETAGRCKHLTALGVYRLKTFVAKTHPTFSQALSALVKSLRIRRLEEAVYWIVYMDTFPDAQHRYRVARRLLIGTGEDGHSLAVMEKCAQNYPKLAKKSTELLYLIAEAARICKLPNWWHPDSNGPDYIYSSLVGQRRWQYKQWDYKLPTLLLEIKHAIEGKDRQMAIGGVMAYADLEKTERVGATKQAEFLLGHAEIIGHEQAARLCEVHLSRKSALSEDNNFLCMAAWLMAGGASPILENILPVTEEESHQLLEQAKESWEKPHPIPTWACDGVHCAGNDTRFMGMLPEMWGVCRAFEHYGRIDPEDKWLPAFQCYDGLIIQDGT